MTLQSKPASPLPPTIALAVGMGMAAIDLVVWPFSGLWRRNGSPYIPFGLIWLPAAWIFSLAWAGWMFRQGWQVINLRRLLLIIGILAAGLVIATVCSMAAAKLINPTASSQGPALDAAVGAAVFLLFLAATLLWSLYALVKGFFEPTRR